MLRIEFEREDDGRWIGDIPALPGVMAYGATRAEAQAKVEALALRVLADRTGERRRLAIARARDACAALARKGVTARVIGSLATGRFGPHSDVDFLVTECPRLLKYAIEGTVEDCLGGMPFDVVYLDEVPAARRDRLLREAVDAGHLR
ncbi:MAG: nucleotidyltransferase domain-containing protein [Alphaproteobacteria bacterium]